MYYNMQVAMRVFLCFCFLSMLLLAVSASAAIDVDGVGEKGIYVDSVEFTVNSEAGYTYDVVTLNDDPIAVDTLIKLNYAQYFQLYVHRINDTTSAEESLTIQFIIRDSERLFSEVGLPTFTPYPPIDSAAAEFVGATLNIVTPANYPMGLEISVAARVNDPNEMRVGVVGDVTAAGFEGYPLKLLRGVGSVFLPAATAPGTLNYNAAIHSLSTPKTINIEPSTTWQTESGNINSNTNWGTNARIHIDGQLTIGSSATLTIGQGSVVKVDPDLEIIVNGSIVVNGTNANPVTFTTDDRNIPWGGILFPASTSVGNFSGTIMTASGADSSWSPPSGQSVGRHRSEQPLLYLYDGADVTLTDCYLIDHHGTTGASKNSTLTMTRCLVQQFVTVGQFNNGSISFNDCALIEFPAWDAPFVDLDNDGVYMTGGAHFFTDTLIGWALDDNLDAGTGAGGDVTLSRCWLESSYHEAMAWSTNNPPPRGIDVTDTVTMNCGQGIEAGFGEPKVTADHCFSTANAVGARFGDNYTSSYNGLLTVSDSLLLYNLRDVWGFCRDDWTIRTDKMDIQNNYLSIPDPDFQTNNIIWDPITTPSQADLLIPFLPTPATTVGIGLAIISDTNDINEVINGVPVRLSTFTTNVVSIDYIVNKNGSLYDSGTLQFAPGESVKMIQFAIEPLAVFDEVEFTISNPVNADITGQTVVKYFVPVPPPVPYEIEKDIIVVGDDWLYRKGTSEPPSDWNELGFTPDGSWFTGATPIGYERNSGYELCIATEVNDMYNSYWSVYARKTFTIDDPSDVTEMELVIDFDDGYIAYINGVEVDSQNPPNPVVYNEEASATHEAACNGSTEPRDLSAYISLLVSGENVFAFQVHNRRFDSSDLILIPTVSIVTAPTPGDVEPDGDIDLSDFAGMALSWQADSVDVNYNEHCDIDSAVGDGTIDILDLQVLAGNWLAGF